jgi:hypothetical protein
MTIAWSGFPAPQAAVSGDIIVGLLGGTVNQRFNATSWLFTANNLSDVPSAQTSFNNISPLTTKGDLLYFDGSGNNNRIAIGTTNYLLSVVAGVPAWVANPGLLIANNLSDLNSVSTALTNLGLAPASNVTFASVTTTGLNVLSNVNGLTAHSGGGQGSALALTHAINRVTTVAAGGDSVKLPTSVAGETVVVINAAASNALNCFPVSGDAINALAANTALSIAANTTVIFFCAIAGTWNSVVTA